jgi:hypothetical protein
MTTFAQARAELLSALTSASIAATETAGAMQPPYVLVAGGGADPTHVVRGQMPATFRARCIAGAWDDKAAVASLDALKVATLTVLLSLPGWRMAELGDDVIRDYGGAMYLTADCAAARMVDL